MTRRQSAVSMSSSRLVVPGVAAFATTPSTRPNAANVAPIAASTDPSSATSQPTPSARPPWPRSASSASAVFCSLRAQIITCAPASMQAFAMPCPMPPLPPVTTTVSPASGPSVGSVVTMKTSFAGPFSASGGPATPGCPGRRAARGSAGPPWIEGEERRAQRVAGHAEQPHDRLEVAHAAAGPEIGAEEAQHLRVGGVAGGDVAGAVGPHHVDARLGNDVPVGRQEALPAEGEHRQRLHRSAAVHVAAPADRVDEARHVCHVGVGHVDAEDALRVVGEQPIDQVERQHVPVVDVAREHARDRRPSRMVRKYSSSSGVVGLFAWPLSTQ